MASCPVDLARFSQSRTGILDVFYAFDDQARSVAAGYPPATTDGYRAGQSDVRSDDQRYADEGKRSDPAAGAALSRRAGQGIRSPRPGAHRGNVDPRSKAAHGRVL